MYIENVASIVIWIDRCSDEYIRAYNDGTLEIPEYFNGYPVVIQYTCGDVLDEPLAGLGAFTWDTLGGSLVVAAGVAVGAIALWWLGGQIWGKKYANEY